MLLFLGDLFGISRNWFENHIRKVAKDVKNHLTIKIIDLADKKILKTTTVLTFL